MRATFFPPGQVGVALPGNSWGTSPTAARGSCQKDPEDHLDPLAGQQRGDSAGCRPGRPQVVDEGYPANLGRNRTVRVEGAGHVVAAGSPGEVPGSAPAPASDQVREHGPVEPDPDLPSQGPSRVELSAVGLDRREDQGVAGRQEARVVGQVIRHPTREPPGVGREPLELGRVQEATQGALVVSEPDRQRAEAPGGLGSQPSGPEGQLAGGTERPRGLPAAGARGGGEESEDGVEGEGEEVHGPEDGLARAPGATDAASRVTGDARRKVP